MLPFRGQTVQRRPRHLKRGRLDFVEVRGRQLIRLLQMVDLGRLQLLTDFRLQTVFRLIVRLVGLVDHFQVLGPLLRRHIGRQATWPELQAGPTRCLSPTLAAGVIRVRTDTALALATTTIGLLDDNRTRIHLCAQFVAGRGAAPGSGLEARMGLEDSACRANGSELRPWIQS